MMFIEKKKNINIFITGQCLICIIITLFEIIFSPVERCTENLNQNKTVDKLKRFLSRGTILRNNTDCLGFVYQIKENN